MASHLRPTSLVAALLALGLAAFQTPVSAAPPSAPEPAVVKLPRYQVDPAKIFVAGISSGGFAAVQMHVAHSSTFKGSAVYAGGVYWCAGAGGVASASRARKIRDFTAPTLTPRAAAISEYDISRMT